MEDAAIAELDIGNGNSLFGVFDGHGGKHAFNQESRFRNS
jgi:serine/threonine protein phosphatase PrpC